MEPEGMQHFQPGAHGKGESTTAEEIMNRITSEKNPVLTDEDKKVLEEGGYGDYILDIDNRIKDTELPPWMH